MNVDRAVVVGARNGAEGGRERAGEDPRAGGRLADGNGLAFASRIVGDDDGEVRAVREIGIVDRDRGIRTDGPHAQRRNTRVAAADRGRGGLVRRAPIGAERVGVGRGKDVVGLREERAGRRVAARTRVERCDYAHGEAVRARHPRRCKRLGLARAAVHQGHSGVGEARRDGQVIICHGDRDGVADNAGGDADRAILTTRGRRRSGAGSGTARRGEWIGVGQRQCLPRHSIDRAVGVGTVARAVGGRKRAGKDTARPCERDLLHLATRTVGHGNGDGSRPSGQIGILNRQSEGIANGTGYDADRGVHATANGRVGRGGRARARRRQIVLIGRAEHIARVRTKGRRRCRAEERGREAGGEGADRTLDERDRAALAGIDVLQHDLDRAVIVAVGVRDGNGHVVAHEIGGDVHARRIAATDDGGRAASDVRLSVLGEEVGV